MHDEVSPIAGAAPNRDVLTPSQLNTLARDLLEGAFPLIWVEGELGNLSRPSSGHLYFTLKDARAQVRCALFKPKSQWLKFVPRDGLRVLARGRRRDLHSWRHFSRSGGIGDAVAAGMVDRRYVVAPRRHPGRPFSGRATRAGILCPCLPRPKTSSPRAS